MISYVITGLKAIVGSIVTGIITSILYFAGTVMVSNFDVSGAIILILMLLALVINVFVLGYIYNAFWGWS